jgi:hypothetical protein
MEALDPTDRADAVAYLCVRPFGAGQAPTVPVAAARASHGRGGAAGRRGPDASGGHLPQR